MKALALMLAAVALVACADTLTAPHRHVTPGPIARDFCRNGYMVAYNQATGTYDSTYTGCGGGQ